MVKKKWKRKINSDPSIWGKLNFMNCKGYTNEATANQVDTETQLSL